MQNIDEIFPPGKYPALLKSKRILLPSSEELGSHPVLLSPRSEGVGPAGTGGFPVGSNLCCWLWLKALPVVVFGRETRTSFHARGDSRKGLKGTGSGKEEHGTGWGMRR